MSDEAQRRKFRLSFEILRLAALAAFVLLPFTFSDGPISLAMFAWVVPISGAWFVSSLLAWRSGEEIYLAISFIALVFGARWSGIHNAEVSFIQFIQWLCFVITLSGAPMLLFRDRLYRFARLGDLKEG